ncbi:hypothetical protein F4604DRAFT_1932335 [Suillus subluteus]|nr:hypothetical protein F4604DRAFT_1932335 [Suillus subluteus]
MDSQVILVDSNSKPEPELAVPDPVFCVTTILDFDCDMMISTNATTSNNGIKLNDANENPAVSIEGSLTEILDVLKGPATVEELGKDDNSKFCATYKKFSTEYDDDDFLGRASEDMGIILTFAGRLSAVNSTFVGMRSNPGDTSNVLHLIQIIVNGPNSAPDINTVSSSTGFSSSTVWVQKLAYFSLAFRVLAALRTRDSRIARHKEADDARRVSIQTVWRAFLVLIQISFLLIGLSLSAHMRARQTTMSSVIISTKTFNILLEYSVYPALRSMTSHFWKYVPCLQFLFAIAVIFQVDATRCPDQIGGVDELSPTFFSSMEADIDTSVLSTLPNEWCTPHSSVDALLARLSSLLRFGCYYTSITGAMRTTATDILETYANLLPTPLLLQNTCRRATVRLATHPKSHPLYKSLRRAPKRYVAPLLHRLTRRFAIDPWEIKTLTPARRPLTSVNQHKTHIAPSKHQAIQEHAQVQDIIQVYCDGSGHQGGIGAAAILFRAGCHPRTLCFYLGTDDEQTVYEAEAVGLSLAAELIATEDLVFPISICIDNQVAIQSGEGFRLVSGVFIPRP